MRTFARLFLLLVVLTWTAAPLLAAPLSLRPTATIGAASSTTGPGAWARAVLLGFGLAAVGITIRKDTATLANKFVTRASAAAGDYKDGVSNAGSDWETNTKNAESSYEQGTQEAISKKRFGRGVSGAAAKYQTNAVNLGSQRYAGGIANAKEAWQRGVQPALDALKSLQLPPKGPRRSPQNMQRANAVALALGALKN